MSTYILGISAFYHDSAACLVRDGTIVAAAQEERFTRKKHDAEFPHRAVEYCLREAGIGVENLRCIGFYDKPLLTFERLLETHLATAPLGIRLFWKSMVVWIKKKLWIPHIIQEELKCEVPVLFGEHHESHAASAFYPSPFEESAIMTLDGVGEWTTTSYGHGRGSEIHTLAETRFPHSLGLLYSAFTYFTGFKVNSGEYKLMGLAPYGEPKYVQQILDNVLDLKDDGSFKLNTCYFDYLSGLKMTSGAMDDLFDGPPRQPESPLTQREMDIARSCQVVTEEVMLRIARQVHAETGSKNLCMAGALRLTVWETVAFCAKVRLNACGYSQQPAMPVVPSALRWLSGIATWKMSAQFPLKVMRCRLLCWDHSLAAMRSLLLSKSKERLLIMWKTAIYLSA